MLLDDYFDGKMPDGVGESRLVCKRGILDIPKRPMSDKESRKVADKVFRDTINSAGGYDCIKSALKRGDWSDMAVRVLTKVSIPDRLSDASASNGAKVGGIVRGAVDTGAVKNLRKLLDGRALRKVVQKNVLNGKNEAIRSRNVGKQAVAHPLIKKAGLLDQYFEKLGVMPQVIKNLKDRNSVKDTSHRALNVRNVGSTLTGGTAGFLIRDAVEQTRFSDRGVLGFKFNPANKSHRCGKYLSGVVGGTVAAGLTYKAMAPEKRTSGLLDRYFAEQGLVAA